MTDRSLRISRWMWLAVAAGVIAITVMIAPRIGQASHGIPCCNSGVVYIHWPAFSWGQQVTMVDRTQPWPVSTSTSNWNRSDAFIDSGIVHYHWWNCSHAVNCTTVFEIDNANSLFIGATYLFWNATPGNGHISESTYIELNNAYVPSGCDGETASTCRRHTACQEIGHALGLDHQTGSSCMDDTDFSELTPEYRNSTHDDHDQLHQAYDHGYHG